MYPAVVPAGEYSNETVSTPARPASCASNVESNVPEMLIVASVSPTMLHASAL